MSLSLAWTKHACRAAEAALDGVVAATRADPAARATAAAEWSTPVCDALARACDRLSHSLALAEGDAGPDAATDREALALLTAAARVVRNCCAECPPAQDVFGAGGAHLSLCNMLTATALLAEGGEAWTANVLSGKLVAVTALVNLAAGHVANAASVWQHAWPSVFVMTLQAGVSARDRQLVARTAALLHTLTVGFPDRLALLASSEPVLNLLLRGVVVPAFPAAVGAASPPPCPPAAAAGDGVSDDDPVLEWVHFLTASLIAADLLPTAFGALCSPDPAVPATSEQLVLAELTAAACGVDADSGRPAPSGPPPLPHTPALLRSLLRVYTCLDGRTRAVCGQCGGSAVGSAPLRRCGGCRLAVYCSADCQRLAWAAHRPACTRGDLPPTHALYLRLLLRCKLALFHSLAGVMMAVRDGGGGGPHAAGAEAELCSQFVPRATRDVATADSAAVRAHGPPGYKSAVVRVFANAASGDAGAFKDAVVAHGALPVLLNQCKVDPDSPLVREWALLAVRYLCDGHEGAQRVVESLKAVAVAHTPELAALGVRASIDERGKVAFDPRGTTAGDRK